VKYAKSNLETSQSLHSRSFAVPDPIHFGFEVVPWKMHQLAKGPSRYVGGLKVRRQGANYTYKNGHNSAVSRPIFAK